MANYNPRVIIDVRCAAETAAAVSSAIRQENASRRVGSQRASDEAAMARSSTPRTDGSAIGHRRPVWSTCGRPSELIFRSIAAATTLEAKVSSVAHDLAGVPGTEAAQYSRSSTRGSDGVGRTNP